MSKVRLAAARDDHNEKLGMGEFTLKRSRVKRSRSVRDGVYG